MNTYLVPFDDNDICDIFKVYANDWKDCEDKVMDRYINLLDSDELAGIDNFYHFCTYLYDNYNIFIGKIHEIEDFE